VKRGLLASVLLTCLVCFGSLAAVLAAGWSPRLGLDLQGGLEVVYQPVGKATQSQLNTVVAIMDSRANGLGLASPNIGIQGNTVVVQLPGVKNPNAVLNVIGNTAQLFFRPVLCGAPPYSAPSKTSTTTTTSPKSTTTTSPAAGTTTTAPSSSTTTKAGARAPTSGPAPAHVAAASGPATAALTSYHPHAATTTTGAPATTVPTSTSTTVPTGASTSTTTAGGSTTTTAPSGATTTTQAPVTTTTAPNQPPAGIKPVKSDHYVAPPACSPQSRYTTATWSNNSGGGSNPGPGVDDPALASVKSTTALQDLSYRTVLISAGPTNAPGSFRYELGPTQFDTSTTPPTPASGVILSGAQAQLTTTGDWVVNFQIKSQYSAFFDSVAQRNNHLPLAIDLGAYVVSAPTIDTPSFGGSGQITGSFTQQQASQIALTLQYGQFPIHMKPQTITTVSPSLGKASLKAGLLAGLLGLLLVMLYTIFYYRALGIVVVLGLVTTAALLFAIISFLGQSSAGLTLDLSGITGLIVSIGITVDSYVVYFERLKDEVRAGRSIRSSVDKGFQSAFKTIISADMVSLLGALVLWLLSIGSVRGFAFMLGLSTILDMITAYVFTRPLVILLGRNRVFTEMRGLGVARGLAIPAEAKP